MKNKFQLVFIIICATSITSCKKEADPVVVITLTPTPTPAHTIGESFGGGIIFLLDGSKEHGLIAAPSDQSIGIAWSNGSLIATGANSTSMGDGNANTNLIVSTLGSGNYAAKLCYDLVLGGYSDWYLPSLGDLDIMYTNKTTIGGFVNSYYWSSSESPNNGAWQTDFGSGGNNYNLRTFPYPVRAIRSF